jgi:hypothetical protein
MVLTVFLLAFVRFISRWGFVIRCIKARTFEDHLGGRNDAFYAFLPALGADFQWRVVKGLMALELNAT